MKKTLYFVLFVLIVLAVRQWEGRAIEHPPGVLVPEMPLQRNLAAPAVFEIGHYRVTPRADYRIRARVLGREDYYLGDESDLSPTDLALGWGVMSDQAVLDRIDITQGGRWYYTRYDYPAPVSDRQIIGHSGNVHMIPANSRIQDKLDDVRVGDLVQLRGQLVDIDREDGFRWRTSLTRNDTGNGSCEIFYVEQLQIEARP